MKVRQNNNNFYDLLIDPGYIVFEQSLPSKNWFKALYEEFDKVIDKLNGQHDEELRTAALNWLKEGDNDKYFCGIPPAFRNRAGVDRKRNKLYLQYCSEFAKSSEFAKTWIAKQPETIALIDKIKEVESICSIFFSETLQGIIKRNPRLSEYYDFNRPLPIITKLVRYNKDESRFATDPHFDKSALSIIIDADDDRVNWKIGKGMNCLLSDMNAPFDYPNDMNAPNHCILFSGLCLKQAGIDLSPAPHYVMPVIKKHYRHSMIAFLLIPYLPNTDTLNTQASYIHDIMKEIN